MRPITLILDRFDPDRGGLESYAHFLLERFHAQRGEAHLITGPSPKGVPRGVTVHSIPEQGAAFYRAVPRRFSGFRRSHLLLSMRHPGPMAEVFLPLGGLFRDALEARRRSEPVWRRVPSRLARWFSGRTSFFLELERQFFEQEGRLVLCSSTLVAEKIRARFPDFRGRLEVTGLPIDPHRFFPPEPGEVVDLRASLGLPPPPAYLLLWVGNDPRRKGLEQALFALNRLRQRKVDAYLLCLGRSLPGKLERHPRCFSRWVSDPSPYFRASDLFLLPTFEDNYSLSLLEALACGLPVITTRENGAHVHVRDSITGRILSHPKALDELDVATLTLLPLKSPAFSRHRRKAILSTFEEEHFARVEAILQSWEQKLRG